MPLELILCQQNNYLILINFIWNNHGLYSKKNALGIRYKTWLKMRVLCIIRLSMIIYYYIILFHCNDAHSKLTFNQDLLTTYDNKVQPNTQ